MGLVKLLHLSIKNIKLPLSKFDSIIILYLNPLNTNFTNLLFYKTVIVLQILNCVSNQNEPQLIFFIMVLYSDYFSYSKIGGPEILV